MFQRLKDWKRSVRARHKESIDIPYQYSPVNVANDEIRILTILPGKLGTEVRILIQSTRLAKDFQPSFEALSYVWGLTEDPTRVYVGESGNVVLSITRNLGDALQHMRYEDRCRVFWIDAICVNQQDVDERSQQVRRMIDIYSMADRVVAWLGPSDSHSSLALITMGHLGSKIIVDWLRQTITPRPGSDQHWANPRVRLPYDDMTTEAISQLLNRPYFQRLWILQEIQLAGPSAIMVCGSETVLWIDFRSGIFALRLKGDVSEGSFRFAYNLCRIVPGIHGLRGLIDITRHSKCSNERDRIYAIASLCHSRESRLIEPDYSKSILEVYRDTVLRTVLALKDLDLLRCCNLQAVSAGDPTWVPNWIVTNPYVSFPDPPGIRTFGSVVYNEPGLLSVTGLLCGTINMVHDFSDISPTGFHHLRDFAPADTLTGGMYLDGKTKLEAFCRTIFANEFQDIFSNPDARPDWPRINEVLTFIGHMLDPHSSSTSHVSRPHPLRTLKFLPKRSFFATNEGYIGIAPGGTRIGDRVSTLLGCRMPIILRPTVQRQYQVIGESYVHGLMCHESLLGQLPPTLRPVFSDDTTDGFRDSETGRIYSEDPRAGPLPNDWKMDMVQRLRGEGVVRRFTDYNRAEVTGRDPRLTSTAIKARGVMLERIDLV